MNFYVYLIVALGCFVGELFTMEFSLTCLGVGFLGAALVSWLGMNLWIQIAMFALVSMVCWIGVRPVALKHLYNKTKEVKTPAENVVGKPAIVEVAIDGLTIVIVVDGTVLVHIDRAAIRPAVGFVAVANQRRDVQPRKDGNLVTRIDSEGRVVVVHGGSDLVAPLVFRRLVDKIDVNT